MFNVIFACKSNSCRSQMAEGWAKDWIRRKKDTLDENLKIVREGNEKIGSSCSDIEKNIAAIEKFVIASVALDSSAVFTAEPEIPFLEMQTLQQRIPIKSKAAAAMAEDGVDISCYVRKTARELLLTEGKETFKNGAYQSDACHAFLNQEEKSSLEGPSLDNKVTVGDDVVIDRLVVLCSCGDNMKLSLMRCSKYVEEWDIEPPTAAAKSGEGDAAYRRVSLMIRDEVNDMMESLLGTDLK